MREHPRAGAKRGHEMKRTTPKTAKVMLRWRRTVMTSPSSGSLLSELLSALRVLPSQHYFLWHPQTHAAAHETKPDREIAFLGAVEARHCFAKETRVDEEAWNASDRMILGFVSHQRLSSGPVLSRLTKPQFLATYIDGDAANGTIPAKAGFVGVWHQQSEDRVKA
jgi:hypothetical protein